jgi:multiple sugar transport system permease protein
MGGNAVMRTPASGAARSGRGLSDSQFALTIVAAVILFNAIVIIVPLIYSAWISLNETNVILRKQEFVGAEHYQKLLNDPDVINAIGIGLRFTAVAVILSLIVGLGIALVLNADFRGRGILRAIVLLPWAISEVVTATMWIFIVNPTFGGLNGILVPLGIVSPNYDWLNERAAIYWMAIAFVWHIAPLGAFFFLAALQTVPADLYRAARIDRAGPVARFFHVTLPHLRYVVLIVLVVVTVEAFREFDLIFAFTRGGPGTSTLILPLLIYRYQFEFSQYGLAAAASYLMIAIAMILTTVYFVILTYRRRAVHAAPADLKPVPVSVPVLGEVGVP